MSQEVRNVEPKELWNNFADLNAVPRPSKKEERVIQFMVDFGKKLSLETFVDGVGNVIIKKPASPGMEDRQIVVLQSHLDMVCQKNNDTEFDFDTQGIEMIIEGDWIKAKGTTLGADNGIGVASIMTILASDTITHPPLEALFTIDEETGMTGALGLVGGLLDADIMLNLDTEDDDELTIGCAGGVDVTATGTYNTEKTPANMVGYKITVNGLSGGHSGMQIHEGLGNANKLMNRILFKSYEKYGLRIAEIDGGSLRNAIPRESVATVTIPEEQDSFFVSHIADFDKMLKTEFSTTDPDLQVTIEKVACSSQVANEEFQDKLIAAIYTCPFGIYRMSPDIDGLVQTSNNVARVVLNNGEYSVQCLTRSSVESEKWDLAQSIQSAFELIGATVIFDGDYPGWEPKPDAEIIKIMSDLFRKTFNAEPKVNACHAGLECGILGTNYPEMQMISFGPNIRGAHSPDERVQISSVKKYWDFLLYTLGEIPKK